MVGWDDYDFDAKYMANDLLEYSGGKSINDVVFDHNFAKALWKGVALKITTTPFEPESKDKKIMIALWKHHLQQMVIAEDPIRYLSENI